VAIIFIGGGNWNTQRKPPTCHKSLINYHIICVKIHAWDKDIIEKDIQPSYYPI
jgi:hypothetical protein